MNYQQAFDSLPLGAFLSASFGYPIDESYSEIWRTPEGRRYSVQRINWPLEDQYEVKTLD